MSEVKDKSPLLYTIGHSTKSLEALIEILEAYHIELLGDIRTVPRSRRNPQFNKESFPAELSRRNIHYLHLKGLGGLRKPAKDSPNVGWENASFQGYADYMQTPEFLENLAELIELAQQQRTAIMCAEALPWRCHRSLIADMLTVRGFEIEHIMSKNRTQKHTLTSWAHVDGLRITYPPSETENR
jgi:uncharacterized protein (DUF488 family)